MIKKIKIKDIGEVISGSTPKTGIQEYWNGNNNWITPAELTDSSYLIDETERKITDLAVEKTSLKKLPKGTVLLTSRAPIGKVAIANAEMYCNQGFKNIICNEKIYNKFLYYVLKSKTEYLNSLGRGATFKEISKSIVENIEIPYYSIEKQKSIVEVFEKIQQLIDINKEQKCLFDNLIKSQFVEMFKNEKNQEILNNVCKFINGDRGKNYPSAGEFVESGIPFINAGLIKEKKVNWEEMNYITEEKYNKLGSGKIQKDDILYCLRGSLGKHCIIDVERRGAIASSLVILRANKEKILPEFLLNILDTDEIIIQQEQANNGSSQPNLSAGSVKNYKIKLPNIKRQEEFVNIVKKIDKQKFETQNKLRELEKIKECLMNKYFN